MVKYGGRSSKQIEQWAKYKAINNLDIDNNSLNNVYSLSQTEPVIRVFSSNNGFLKDYSVSDYADIGTAIQQAIDDMKSASVYTGKIELPPGEFSYSTTPVIDIPISIIGQGMPTLQQIFAVHGGTYLRPDSVTHGLILRETSDTPISNLAGVELRGFSMRPVTDFNVSNGIYLDGVHNGTSSTVRSCTFQNIGTHAFNNGGIYGEGTVFSLSFYNHKGRSNGLAAILIEQEGTGGPPSGIWLYGCQAMPDDSAAWGWKIRTNEIGIFGGKVEEVSNPCAGGIYTVGANGGIYGTALEAKTGHTSTSSIGVQVGGPFGGHFDVNTITIAKFDTGVAIGDGSGNDTPRVTVRGHPNNSITQDVLIRNGGDRQAVKIPHTLGQTITNQRQTVDGVKRVHLLTGSDLYPCDVRTRTSARDELRPSIGYHDGSGTGNPEGPAFFDLSGTWISLVDGNPIT